MKHPWPLSIALTFALAAASLAAADLSARDADSLARKLVVIQQRARAPRKAEQLTRVTENEVNAYLRFAARDELPAGVVEPAVSILGDSRVAGRATVDLDGVRRAKSTGGWLDPTSYLTGRVPVAATGFLRTKDGTARFELESADVAGLPVPKMFLQEIVSYYSRTPADPDGIRLDDTYQLPARIREIRVGRGEAVVVQ